MGRVDGGVREFWADAGQQDAFCAQYGLATTTFWKWRQRLASERGAMTLSARPPKLADFVSLALPAGLRSE